MRKSLIVTIALILAIAGGLYFLKIFPDPYHKEGLVNFYTWAYREIDELKHGEKG